MHSRTLFVAFAAALSVIGGVGVSSAQQTRPAAGGAETRPAAPADASTPRGALRLLHTAMRDGNVESIKKLYYTATPAEVKMVSTMADLAAALAALHRAAVEAFGDGEQGAWKITGDTDAASAKSLASIDEADVTITGDTASVRFHEDADADEPDEKEKTPAIPKDPTDPKASTTRLKKIDGRWQVPAADLAPGEDADALDQRLAELATQRRVLTEITADISAGKFKTAEKAAQACGSRMMQAATSRPSTTPTPTSSARS